MASLSFINWSVATEALLPPRKSGKCANPWCEKKEKAIPGKAFCKKCHGRGIHDLGSLVRYFLEGKHGEWVGVPVKARTFFAKFVRTALERDLISSDFAKSALVREVDEGTLVNLLSILWSNMELYREKKERALAEQIAKNALALAKEAKEASISTATMSNIAVNHADLLQPGAIKDEPEAWRAEIVAEVSETKTPEGAVEFKLATPAPVEEAKLPVFIAEAEEVKKPVDLLADVDYEDGLPARRANGERFWVENETDYAAVCMVKGCKEHFVLTGRDIRVLRDEGIPALCPTHRYCRCGDVAMAIFRAKGVHDLEEADGQQVCYTCRGSLIQKRSRLMVVATEPCPHTGKPNCIGRKMLDKPVCYGCFKIGRKAPALIIQDQRIGGAVAEEVGMVSTSARAVSEAEPQKALQPALA